MSGLRVVDLSRAISGPYASLILGDLGAEIIKIESPEGDFSRVSAGPSYKGENFYYLAFNRNKKSVALDLLTCTGKEAFFDLVRVSDVVIENLRAGAMSRLGADYDTLSKVNPRIIYCSITGYGSSGPGADRPAYDIAVLAASGILGLSGEPGGPPTRPGIPIADQSSAFFAAIGILSALAERHRTGKGSKVDVSLMDSCVSLLSYPLSYYFATDVVPAPLGNSGHLILVPYGVYKTRSGYIALGVCWPRITRAIGAEWLAEDPRFRDLSERQAHRDELNALMEECFATLDADDWIEVLRLEDISAAKVATLDEVVADPQVRHQNMILSLEHFLGGEVRLVGNPIKMKSIDESDYTAPPTLNQHEREVLSGLLGYSEDKLEALRREAAENAAGRLEHLQKVT